MKGFMFKVIILALPSATLFPITALASHASDATNQIKNYQTKMGCMTCHQAESMQDDGESDNSEDN